MNYNLMGSHADYNALSIIHFTKSLWIKRERERERTLSQ